ncbi:MAG: hypothetical protein JST83_05970 [Bacteroidetes bacterium]|nr:hypothetical protein [Bacteroidota bacterium]
MKNSIIAGVVLLITALGAASCRKDIYGCTDPYASNYAPNANVDNGSCTYIRYGEVIFWFPGNYGTGTVNISGQTGSISGYVTGGVPSCGNSVSATFSLPEGQYNYTATATNGYSWHGVATVVADGCQAYELQ